MDFKISIHEFIYIKAKIWPVLPNTYLKLYYFSCYCTEILTRKFFTLFNREKKPQNNFFVVQNSILKIFRNSDYNEPKNYDYGDYSNQPPHVIAQKSVDGASGREILKYS